MSLEGIEEIPRIEGEKEDDWLYDPEWEEDSEAEEDEEEEEWLAGASFYRALNGEVTLS